MHPEHLLLMKQLVAAVQDMGCTLKSLNSTVNHLMKEKQGRDIGTSTEDDNREMMTSSPGASRISIPENLSYCNQQLAKGSTIHTSTVDNQNPLTSSEFYVGNTERSMDMPFAEEEESQSGSDILERIEEVSVVKEEELYDEEAGTNCNVQLITECNEECDMEEQNENMTPAFEGQESENRGAVNTVNDPLSGGLDRTENAGMEYGIVGANSFCEVIAECSGSAGRSLAGQSEEELGEWKHKCSVCDRIFIAPSQLKVHMRTHSGEKPFVCPVCGKAFIQQCTLRRHALVHSNEKPFQCTHCESSFREKASLKKHMFIHSQKWPYTCELCGKGVSSFSALRVHMRSHSGHIII